MAAAGNWDSQLVAPLVELFRDPYPEIRGQAVQQLCGHEPKERGPAYLELLKDTNPNVPACALMVLGRIAPDAIPRAELLQLLSRPQLNVVSLSLTLLQGTQSDMLGRPPVAVPGSQFRPATDGVTSMEAAPLTTNRLTMARLMGLELLRQNADADAITLTLPLLRDTNSIVRKRAFELLKTVSGQDFQPNDAAKWEEWWAANRATFKPAKPNR